MGYYFNTGKQVLFKEEGFDKPTLHIADARDNEASHLIAHTLNQRSENFIKDALRTCSPNFYGERVAMAEFIEAVNEGIKAANRLDKIKKSLFYGRDNNLDPREGERSCNELPGRVYGKEPVDLAIGIDFIHGILGKFTEAGELLEALRNAYRDDGIDLVNVNEEIGDGFWYDAILLNRTDSTFEEVQERIIKKLRARFPDKYEDAHANERDLEAERAILEGDVGMPMDVRINEADFDPNFPTVELNPPVPDGYIHEFSENELIREGGGIYAKPVDDPNIFQRAITDSLPNYISASYEEPLLAPAVPASGAEAVKAAEASAKDAFDKIADVQANVGKPESKPNDNPEFAKPAGERSQAMPFEGTAQASGKAIEKASKS